MRKQVPNYKDYGGNYRAFVRAVIEYDKEVYDGELGERLESVQDLFDGCRPYVIKQKSAVTNIIIGGLSCNPPNPLSEEEVASLHTAWGEDFFNAKLIGICAPLLLMGKPGRAKTVLCLLIAALIKASFARISCTVDLDPSDIRGSAILLSDGTTRYISGPIENNIVLADEINRATGKAQGAFLEPMAEGRLTRNLNIGKDGENTRRTIVLPRPFYVIATMNPLEQESVYRLPEAQQDRFAMQIIMTGISIASIMKVMAINEEEYIKSYVKPVMTTDDLLNIRQFIHEKVKMTKAASRYTARLGKSLLAYNDLPEEEEETDADFLRELKVLHQKPMEIAGHLYKIGDLVADIMYERMAIVMGSIAKTQAFLRGRRYVLPEDIAKIFPHVSRHRMFLTRDAEALLQQQLRTENNRILDRAELTNRIMRHVLMHVPIPAGERGSGNDA